MKIDKIIIANLKCSGCENTIKTKFMAIEGVKVVEISQEEDTVTVQHIESISREVLTEKLLSLGYPEATEENGLLVQLKSYASCMAGRINK